MTELIKKNKHRLIWIAPVIILLGAVLLRFGLKRNITIVLDGDLLKVETSALTVSGALRSAGIKVDDQDRVSPEVGGWLKADTVISVEQAQEIIVVTPDEELSIVSAERIPANLLGEVGITLYPHDRVWRNGVAIDPDQPLEYTGSVLLQYVPAIPITLQIGEEEQVIFTSEPTLGAALEAASIQLAPEDWISEDLMTPITDSMEVVIRRAQPVTVTIGESSLSGLSAASTVGEALLDLNLPLQNLDYSIPAEDAPLPATREIEVVRVDEDVVLTTDEVAYENEYVEDPDTLLDTTSVIEPGQLGIYATRERVRYANGEEVWRDVDERWQASEPRDGVLGYGTKVQVRTEVVDGQTIEYWRKISVYAVSYKPCDSQGVCHYGTAGGFPVQQGIIAVSPYWYSVPNGLAMADQNVYIPGYGRAIVGDTCGGCSGTYMIDLAYSEENYVPWSTWTTMYFLTPVPNWYPAIITP